MELYRARWVIPVNAEPIEDGILGVDHGRITYVGAAAASPRGLVNDLGDCLLTPGFINAHTHLELSSFHKRLAPSSLWDWFDELWRLIRGCDFEAVGREAVSLGAVQSLRAGVTCVGDISRTGLNIPVLRESPIRKVGFLELISGARLPPNDAGTLAEALAEWSRFAEPERLVIGVSPHALYTVTDSDLAGVAELARANDLLTTMHFLETPEEREWLAGKGGRVADFITNRRLPTTRPKDGARAVERFSDAPLLLAHCNFLEASELAAVARSNISVVYCPRTHRFFGHKPHGWRSMLAAGINVCVGTDSLASNDSLSILAELRFLFAEHPDAPPGLLMEMGTIRAARAMRLARSLGTLETGKCADFVAVPFSGDRGGDPLIELLRGEANPAQVWIGGNLVVDRAGG